MKLKVEIRRNADGEIATDIWPDWDFNQYYWEEGSAQCDCNRHLFFDRAQGKEGEHDWKGTACSDGKYSVRLSDADTGEVLYNELGT